MIKFSIQLKYIILQRLNIQYMHVNMYLNIVPTTMFSDNDDPTQGGVRSAACTLSSLFHHGNTCSCVLTLLCCYLILSSVFHVQ